MIKTPKKKHYSFFVCIVVFGLLCNTSSALASEKCQLLNKPYTAIYYGSYKGWRLDATQKLEITQGNERQFTLIADNPIGQIHESSTFTLGQDEEIISKSYHYLRKVLFKTRDFSIDFDWQKKMAETKKDGHFHTLELKGGELDDLNYHLTLRCDLKAGLKDFSYAVTERKQIDELNFKIIGEEKLATELGQLNTVVVKRIRNNNNRNTTIWFAKDYDYLMVKLLQEERKDTEAYLLYIKSLEQ